MPNTITAVYQDGILRPARPLALAEGETVEITVVRAEESVRAKEEDDVRRIRAAATLDEWIAVANSSPDEDEQYDLLAALDANRLDSGDTRPLFHFRSCVDRRWARRP